MTSHSGVIERRVPSTLIGHESKAGRVGFGDAVHHPFIPVRRLYECRDMWRILRPSVGLNPGNEDVLRNRTVCKRQHHNTSKPRNLSGE